MLGEYRFVVEVELVRDMADEFCMIMDTYEGINSERVCAYIDALMDAEPESFETVLLNVDGPVAYFIAMPPRKWVDGLAMVRKMVRV